LIIVAVIIIAAFLYRATYLSPKETNNRSSKPYSTNELNRNEEKLILTKHAKCRMECRDITYAEIKEILQDGKINYTKSDIDNARGATFALEGYSNDKQHLRIVFAPAKNKTVVITCIDLDKEWQCDCN